MHSFHGNTINIHYNGDYSGDIIINNKLEGEHNIEIKVSIDDIFNFIAGYIRSEKISKLESMTSMDIILNLGDI